MEVHVPTGRDLKIAISHKAVQVYWDKQLKVYRTAIPNVFAEHMYAKTTIHKGTLVRITEEDKLISRGETFLHPNDVFCRKTGIKMALSRAMKRQIVITKSDGKKETTSEYIFTKPEREAIWKTVLNIKESKHNLKEVNDGKRS